MPRSGPGRIALLSNHFSGRVKLDYWLRHGLLPEGIVTMDETLAQKCSVSGYSDFSEVARRNGIELYRVHSPSLKHAEDLEYFRSRRFDLIVIGGWQRLVPAEILRTARIGAVAEHGSGAPLPRGRGRSPINWTIIGGSDCFVVHIFFAAEDADSGAVIDSETFEITAFDTVETVYFKVGICTARMLLQNLDGLLDGTAKGTPQDPSVEPTYFRKRSEADDFIDWAAESTRQVHDHIRASTHPYPMAKSRLEGSILHFIEAHPFDGRMEFPDVAPGEIIQVFPGGGLLVKTLDGSLLVKKYRCDGEPRAGLVLRP
jgi:methionyl-tRNA formyltransferase